MIRGAIPIHGIELVQSAKTLKRYVYEMVIPIVGCYGFNKL